jgi:hypothetical protein
VPSRETLSGGNLVTTFQRALLALLAIAILGSAWMFRYAPIAGSRVPFVLDRWTGKVYIAKLVVEE